MGGSDAVGVYSARLADLLREAEAELDAESFEGFVEVLVAMLARAYADLVAGDG